MEGAWRGLSPNAVSASASASSSTATTTTMTTTTTITTTPSSATSTSSSACARTGEPIVAGPSGLRPRCRRRPSCEDNDLVGETSASTREVRRRPRRGNGATTLVFGGGRAKRAHSPDADSSSDTGNDDYSVGSDDCCIYTYRGGEHLAELHSSFYSLDVGPAAESHLPAPPLFGPRQEPPPVLEERAPSSPDMDYLEMDFDPGPSCEVDSDDDTVSDVEADARTLPEENGLDRSPERKEISEKESNLDVKPEPSPVACGSGETTLLNSLSNDVSDESSSARMCNGRCYHESDARNDPSSSEMNLPSTSSATGCRGAFAKRNCVNAPANVRTDRIIEENNRNNRPYGSLIPHITPSGQIIYVRRTSLSWPTREIQGHHNSSGDLISPGEACEGDLPDSFLWANIGHISSERAGLLEASRINHASTLFHCTMAKKLVVEKQAAKFLQDHDTSNIDGAGLDGIEEPPVVSKFMIWSEQEACTRQITQIGTSACGATAVINTLLAFKQPIDVERITSVVGTRLRANNAPLCRYLISRAIAGCNVDGLASGLNAGSGGTVSSRHFSTWPERAVSLSHWLAYWIELGAIPIATLNLQADIADYSHIPDSWHHQMIFGVGPRGIYMTNPLECVEEGALWHQLCSDSILLIKRKDILSRWNRNTDLTPLMQVPGDHRWNTMNVLGQVVSLIRESQNTNSTIYTSHIKIPACYSAGITIAVLTGSEAHKRLLQAPELPLLIPEDE